MLICLVHLMIVVVRTGYCGCDIWHDNTRSLRAQWKRVVQVNQLLWLWVQNTWYLKKTLLVKGNMLPTKCRPPWVFFWPMVTAFRPFRLPRRQAKWGCRGGLDVLGIASRKCVNLWRTLRRFSHFIYCMFMFWGFYLGLSMCNSGTELSNNVSQNGQTSVGCHFDIQLSVWLM